jgi:adenylyltransferase/sulfurtransferase
VPSCAEAGVLGVLPGLVAMIQATEALKLLAGIGEPLLGRFVQYDALEMRFSEFRFGKDPECAACGPRATLPELVDYDGFCGVPAAREEPLPELSADAVRRRGVPGRDFLLLDVREPDEHAKARIEGARLLPLGELAARSAELEAWRERPVVVHCHHGGRSAKAARWLREHGPGIQHVAFEVDDLDAALAALKEQGVQMIDAAPRPGKQGSRVAFIHPRATGRVLFELVENRKK